VGLTAAPTAACAAAGCWRPPQPTPACSGLSHVCGPGLPCPAGASKRQRSPEPPAAAAGAKAGKRQRSAEPPAAATGPQQGKRHSAKRPAAAPGGQAGAGPARGKGPLVVAAQQLPEVQDVDMEDDPPPIEGAAALHAAAPVLASARHVLFASPAAVQASCCCPCLYGHPRSNGPCIPGPAAAAEPVDPAVLARRQARLKRFRQAARGAPGAAAAGGGDGTPAAATPPTDPSQQHPAAVPPAAVLPAPALPAPALQSPAPASWLPAPQPPLGGPPPPPPPRVHNHARVGGAPAPPPRAAAAGGGCMERHVGRMCRAPLRAPPHLWVHEQRCTASADYVTMRARADSACRQRGWGRVGALNPDSGLPRPAAAPRGDPGLRRRLATAGRRDSTHRASLP